MFIYKEMSHCYNNSLSYVDLDANKAVEIQKSSSVWIRDIEDINGNKLFSDLTYIDGTKILMWRKRNGKIIIEYNG